MSKRTLRVLVAKPGLDGHDRGARVVASALRDAGFEVIYTGLRASIPAIVTAAIQEDVDVIGLSVLSGAHESICGRLLAGLRERGAEIPIVLGGIIPDHDKPRLFEMGVKAVFGPESPLEDLVEAIRALGEGRAPQAPVPTPIAKPPKVVGLSHVAVCVGDLDEASRVFEQVLGVKPAHREYVPEQKTEAVFFDLGNSCSIELICPRGGNEGLEKFLQKRGPGLHHIALQVEGLARGLGALQQNGLSTIDREPRRGARGHTVAFLHPKSAGGVLVEFVEEGHAKADAKQTNAQPREDQPGA